MEDKFFFFLDQKIDTPILIHRADLWVGKVADLMSIVTYWATLPSGQITLLHTIFTSLAFHFLCSDIVRPLISQDKYPYIGPKVCLLKTGPVGHLSFNPTGNVTACVRQASGP